jgi:hypothetical protein
MVSMQNFGVIFSRFNADRICTSAHVYAELSDLLFYCNEVCPVKRKEKSDQTSARTYFRREHVRLIHNEHSQIHVYICIICIM